MFASVKFHGQRNEWQRKKLQQVSATFEQQTLESFNPQCRRELPELKLSSSSSKVLVCADCQNWNLLNRLLGKLSGLKVAKLSATEDSWRP